MKTTLHGNENTDYTAVRENASFQVIFCSVLISVYSNIIMHTGGWGGLQDY